MTMPNIERCFAQARNRAAMTQVVVVRTDGTHLLFPAPAKESVRRELLASTEHMMPSATRRQVAVVADTNWASCTSPALQEANQAIPFFGILMGLACIGHSVWIFNGMGGTLTPGCRNAHVLIVDSATVHALPIHWQAEARKVMQGRQIVIHDRGTYSLRDEP